MRAYLHWEGPPFLTVSVPVRHEYADRYLIRYDSKWRRVHIQVKRLYIVVNGERVTVQIEGDPV